MEYQGLCGFKANLSKLVLTCLKMKSKKSMHDATGSTPSTKKISPLLKRKKNNMQEHNSLSTYCILSATHTKQPLLWSFVSIMLLVLSVLRKWNHVIVFCALLFSLTIIFSRVIHAISYSYTLFPFNYIICLYRIHIIYRFISW